MPLTDTKIKLAKPKLGEYNLADGSGLYLRVKPSSSKLWIFNYSKPYTGKRSNISLGTYPKLSLANARKQRDKLNELLANKIDPKHHRAEQNRTEQNRQGKQAHENTFQAAYDALQHAGFVIVTRQGWKRRGKPILVAMRFNGIDEPKDGINYDDGIVPSHSLLNYWCKIKSSWDHQPKVKEAKKSSPQIWRNKIGVTPPSWY